MAWDVGVSDEFEPEFSELEETVQDKILALMGLLEEFGPTLSRPYADTLKGSKHSNMRELRFDAASGVWRIAYAFDPKRKAILLVAGDKRGKNETQFYKKLIKVADARFDNYLT